MDFSVLRGSFLVRVEVGMMLIDVGMRSVGDEGDIRETILQPIDPSVWDAEPKERARMGNKK